MKIAIYHGFEKIHYEMLLYIIDYFTNINNNIEATYYLNKSNVIMNIDVYDEWTTFYNKMNNIINFKHINNFNPNNYDYILLLTDDDYSFNYHWFLKYKNKIISIKHCHLNRTPPVFLNINTRYIFDQPKNKWVLPVYNGISKIYKFNLIAKSNKIKVVSIGKVFPPSYIYLYNIFENIDDIEFNFISLSHDYLNNYDYNKLKYPNINIHLDTKLEDLFNFIYEASYVFISDITTPNNDDINLNHRIAYVIQSGLFLSISNGCSIIMPSKYNRYYGLKNVITYDSNLPIDDIINDKSKIKLEPITPIKLNKLYMELYELINHRNTTFNNIFNNNIFVYITFNEEHINTYSDIKERYLISDIFYNKNINVIDNINFIFRINTKILFLFNYDSLIKERLMLLNTRQYPDIIIIIINTDDYNMFIKELNTYYDKSSYIDYINNQLIIIPHK